MPRAPEKKLLVEGDVDKRIIPHLIEANGIAWGETAQDAIVYIEAAGSYSKILQPLVIETELKASGLRILGVLLDADQDAQARWQALRNRCMALFPTVPQNLPPDGLVVENEAGQRFGAWILPNNQDAGMMETFLKYLVPAQYDTLWQFAQTATNEAQAHGAPFRADHRDKAEMHTMLAWSDPPGRQLHQAIIERILDPTSPAAKPFCDWFCRLYEIDLSQPNEAGA